MNAQRRLSSDDIISTLPLDVLETILCLLPIQEAGRTSILSRDWRYKWTKIPKLTFEEDTFQVSTNKMQPTNMNKKCRLFYAIYQVLLLHQGPIYEFNLSLHANMNVRSCFIIINPIILDLSRRNTVKKLSLSNLFDKLPLCVFSFDKLTHLELDSCYIKRQATFKGFGSLTSLHLKYANFSKKKLLHLLANCPLLKSFTLIETHNKISSDDDSTVIELFECLPMIENLTICAWGTNQFFGQLPRIRELPTSLLHLKYIHFSGGYAMEKGYRYLALLMRSSPNLEKIKLQMTIPPCYDKFVDYSNIKLERLIELEIQYFRNLQLELELVKVVLANSPLLKRVRISFYEKVANLEELKSSRLLLSFLCASTGVKISVVNCGF